MNLTERFGTVPDLFYTSNNGVLAIWPTREGKLKDLCLTTKCGIERCWIFADWETHTTEEGDQSFDHHRRGVVCGSWAEGQAFIKMCIDECKLLVKNNGYAGNGVGFVPLSNGERCTGTLRTPGSDSIDRPTCDWDPIELRWIRVDLPVRHIIQALIK